MKNIVFVPMIMAAFALLPLPAFGEDKAGDVIQVKGPVRIERDGASMNAVLAMPVQQGDVITTRANSSIKVLMRDDSVLTIAPDSSFSVREYAYAGGKQRSKSVFKLLFGKLRVVVGRALLKVETETAIAGVRGTVFDVWVDSATHTTHVAVIEGSVELRNIRPEIKGLQIVTGGNESSVAAGEPPQPPTPYTPPPGDQGGGSGEGDGLPGVQPPPGTGGPTGGQVVTYGPPIHQTPQGFSKVGIHVVFP